jgi:hypothetical protein
MGKILTCNSKRGGRHPHKNYGAASFTGRERQIAPDGLLTLRTELLHALSETTWITVAAMRVRKETSMHANGCRGFCQIFVFQSLH